MKESFKDFPEFYNHRAIQSIAEKPKWTVSTNEKVPVDVITFEIERRIVGAKYMGPKSLVTLDKVTDMFPIANNNTFYLNYIEDGFVVLDIEKTCPDDIKKELLSTNYIYGEKSASGLGYHLLFPVPPKHTDFPLISQKRVLQHPQKYYEILLNHYCMFTRDVIPLCKKPKTDFDALFYQLALKQKEAIRNQEIEIANLEPPDIQFKDKAIELLNDMIYPKKLSDFADDISRYEFAFIANYNYRLKMFMERLYITNNIEYTPTEQAWILYLAAKNRLEHRVKHDERRNGLPWLLYVAGEVIAKDTSPLQYNIEDEDAEQ